MDAESCELDCAMRTRESNLGTAAASKQQLHPCNACLASFFLTSSINSKQASKAYRHVFHRPTFAQCDANVGSTNAQHVTFALGLVARPSTSAAGQSSLAHPQCPRTARFGAHYGRRTSTTLTLIHAHSKATAKSTGALYARRRHAAQSPGRTECRYWNLPRGSVR